MVLLLAAAFLFPPITWGAEKTSLLMLAKWNRVEDLRKFFDGDPCVEYSIVVTQDVRVPDTELARLIRLYFPRTYQDLRQYEVLILSCPDYNLLTAKHDGWIHDTVSDGAGGINDGSIFSQIPSIYDAWMAGTAWEAFPNDVPAVIANYASWAPIESFTVRINPDHHEPVLTTFIPFGVEKYSAYGLGRAVVPPTGSSVLAWQVGNYAVELPYLTAWQHGKGRAMTMGGSFPYSWIRYPTEPGGQTYAPEIVMNIVFWLAGTELIDDVEVFHSVKTDFSEFTARLKVLLSLRDFIDKFGASTDRTQREIQSLMDTYAEAEEKYLEHSFAESQASIRTALQRIPAAEAVAKREREGALLWVYVINWLVTTSTLFITGSILWMLMVRRRLYRSVETTKLS